MNSIHELFAIIESHPFSAMVNVASNYKTFVRILASEKAVQKLAEEMQQPDARAAVFSRALALVQGEGEPGFEHPRGFRSRGVSLAPDRQGRRSRDRSRYEGG